jgi:hypothetical protein
LIKESEKNGVCSVLIEFKAYTEKKEKIALDTSQPKRGISDELGSD